MNNMLHPVFNDFQFALKNYANRTTIIDKDGRQYTYHEFEKNIAGCFHYLQSKGLNKGDKVLLAVPMSYNLYAILEALLALGVTVVFLDPWMKGRTMSQIIRQVQPDLFIVTKKLSRITWLLPATWKLKKWKVDSVPSSDQPYEIALVEDEDNALITFTSGTSGEPKGANRTYSFIHAQAETLKPHLVSEKHSIDYTNFPIVGLANFALGNTLAIPQLNLMKLHESSSTEIIHQLIEQKINRLIVSPALLKKALSELKDCSELETVITGGAPISIGLVRSALAHCPHLKFEAIYGSTEAEPICMTTFEEINDQLKDPRKGVFVGKPVAEIRLKIIKAGLKEIASDDLESILLELGEIGEIIVTGKHVNKGYFKNQRAFELNKIRDEQGEIWHRTGDIGYLEADHLFLLGRAHRIMKKDENTYHPYPIEQVLEIDLGIDDVGYVQDEKGDFILFYHAREEKISHKKIKKLFKDMDYPLDKINAWNKPLPRDARHQSKLQIENLV